MLDENEILKIIRTEGGARVEMYGCKKTMQDVLYVLVCSARKVGLTEKELLEAIIFGYADESGIAIKIGI